MYIAVVCLCMYVTDDGRLDCRRRSGEIHVEIKIAGSSVSLFSTFTIFTGTRYRYRTGTAPGTVCEELPLPLCGLRDVHLKKYSSGVVWYPLLVL